MATTEEVFARIVEGVTGQSNDAGIRITSECQPSGGAGTRLMPPTYPSGYLTEDRVLADGEIASVVQLDSYQAQANRVEEALLAARDDARIDLPLFEMVVDVDPWTVRLTSLDFPHRYADAYLRDSVIDGVRFDKTDIGKALRTAEPGRADALFQHDPGALVLGAWNSHRSGRQPKFSRAYRSETLGIGFKDARRQGGRLDPHNLTGSVDDASKREGDWSFVVAEKVKGKRLSEIGHGNALSGEDAPGGVTVAAVRRLAFLSFAQLNRLRFPSVAPGDQGTVRATLAALSLAGDRLAFNRPGLVFRSGCELTVVDDTVEWEQGGGTYEALEMDAADAIDLLRLGQEQSRAAGLPMLTDTIAIEPIPGLENAIRHAYLSADDSAG